MQIPFQNTFKGSGRSFGMLMKERSLEKQVCTTIVTPVVITVLGLDAFPSGTGGYLAMSGSTTLSNFAGTLKVDKLGGSSALGAMKNFTTIASTLHAIKFDFDKGTLNPSAYVVCRIYDPSNVLLFTSPSITVTASYTYSFTSTTAGTYRVEFERLGNNGNKYFLLDNIIITYNSTTSSTTCVGVSNYRYGFNGMEKDDEVKGKGNSYTTDFRQYDGRLGRWFTIDPMYSEASSWTPYRFAFNNPLIYHDPSGDYEVKAKLTRQEKKDIRKNFHGRKARKEEREKAVERKKTYLRNAVSVSKQLIDDDPKVKEAFINFTGVQPGTKQWNQFWEEGNGGPLLVFKNNQTENDVSAMTYTSKGKIEINGTMLLAKAAVTLMHEYVHLADRKNSQGVSYEASTGGIPEYSSQKQLSGFQNVVDWATDPKNSGQVPTEKQDLQNWLKHYGGRGGWLDNSGKAVGVEMGYAFEQIAFGKVPHVDKDYVQIIADHTKPFEYKGK